MQLQRPFLIGQMVYLQPMDGEFYDDQYLDWVNDDEVVDNFGTLFFPTTKESLLDYIKENTNKSNSAFFAIRLKNKNDFIGTSKLGPINWIHRTSHFGTLIGKKEHRGRGLGTEVVKLILSYGFNRLNLHWIGADMVPQNVASIKSKEKAGLKIVASIPKQVWFKGEYVDRICMGITSDEYFASKRGE